MDGEKPPIGPVLEQFGWDGRITGYGTWRKTRCPFHVDRKPSGAVNEDEELFSCHAGCNDGKVMDAYGVVMFAEGTGFEDAKRRVQEITGHSGGPVSRGANGSGKRAGSKLPLWTRDKQERNRLVSARRGNRRLSGAR